MRNIALVSLFAAAEGGNSCSHNHRNGGFGPGAAFLAHPNSSPHRQRPRNLGDDSCVIAHFSFDRNGNDFPAWVKALTRWSDVTEQPPPPPSSSSAEGAQRNEGLSFDSFPFGGNRRSNSDVWQEEMSPLVASLSGMVNVEALVAISNETDEEMDLFLPNIDDLKRTIDTETKNGKDGKGDEQDSTDAKIFPFLDNALRWEEFIPSLQKNVQELTDLLADDNELNVTFEELVNMVPEDGPLADALVAENNDQDDSSPLSTIATEKILQDATQRLELLINDTSAAFSPSAFQSLIIRASDALDIQEASGNLTAAAYSIFQQAGNAPRATAEYTAQLVQFSNAILVDGYEPLFSKYPSVKSIPVEETQQKVIKAAEFASLSGAVYDEPIANSHELRHSIIAKGKTADIGWMVTDSIQYEQDFWPDSERKEPTLVRTFVLRGYDASDEEVDREGLLNVICTADPVPILKTERDLVRVHEGMLSMAQELYQELVKYVDLTSPSHKIVFTGHSIGGSLAILLMILLTNDRGASFVRNNVLRVYTYGSPPIFEIESTSNLKEMLQGNDSCSILEAFDLPNDIVYGYCQPWDPIIRLFSQYDPLYPLIDDLGDDGYTPWVSGPPRTLRPILKTILEAWEGWPDYRDNARLKLGQDYQSVGEQYLLLPEPVRYLTDRLVSVNTAVPPIESIVSVSSTELLPALNEVFLLDVFTISYVSVAIRSFVHHFYPAYNSPVVDYAKKIMEEEKA